MWIFCGGMYRSDSTLQYQIVSEIMELKDLGRRITWEDTEKFPEVKKALEKEKQKYKVFKAHTCSAEIKKEFINKNAFGFYIYRDIRDVIASHMRKNRVPFDEVIRSGIIENCIKNYYEWTALDNVFISKYEEVVTNIKNEILKVADIGGINLSSDEADKIADKLSLENQKRRINYCKESGIFKVLGSEKFDPVTLLHLNHIDSDNGKIEKWKGVLSDEEVKLVEKKYGNWLKENGYTMSFFAGDPLLRYYSQQGEDYILWKFFGYKKNGFFIDIGAFDGIYLSNTYSFELQNWRGICVEPSPFYFKLCKQNRKGSLCLNYACVGDETLKEIVLYTEKTGLLSSIIYLKEVEEDIRRAYEALNLEYEGFDTIKVPAITLNKILEEHLSKGQEIDFVSIDVEGFELDVLKGFDISKYLPNVIILEANKEEYKEKLIHYMAEVNYFLARELNFNLFFVKDQESVQRLRSIEIDCVIEKQLHPLGENYTFREYLKGHVINEKRDEEINHLYMKLQESEADRAARLEVINEQGKRLGELEADRNNLSAELQDLRQRLEAIEADRAARLEVIERQAKEFTERLQVCEADRAARLEVIQRLSGEIQVSKESLKQKYKEIKKRETELEIIKSSLSWRITAPLRWIYDRLIFGGKSK